ncbi:MAG: GNAT family N-acetyltransferase [Proteobacteria bacterium]|nr:GNAT family N-acetyltransferase [Pseudomonadota bacterium]
MDVSLEPIPTERLILRLVTPADAADMSRLMTPEISARVASWPLPFTLERAVQRIIEANISANAGRSLLMGIERRADCAFLGIVGMRRNEANPRLAGMGYWLGAAFHGQGYMREAALAARDACFARFGVDTVEAACQPGNEASLAVIRRLGMQPIGERDVFVAARQRNERVLYFAVRRDAAGPILAP